MYLLPRARRIEQVGCEHYAANSVRQTRSNNVVQLLPARLVEYIAVPLLEKSLRELVERSGLDRFASQAKFRQSLITETTGNALDQFHWEFEQEWRLAVIVLGWLSWHLDDDGAMQNAFVVDSLSHLTWLDARWSKN